MRAQRLNAARGGAYGQFEQFIAKRMALDKRHRGQMGRRAHRVATAGYVRQHFGEDPLPNTPPKGEGNIHYGEFERVKFNELSRGKAPRIDCDILREFPVAILVANRRSNRQQTSSELLMSILRVTAKAANSWRAFVAAPFARSRCRIIGRQKRRPVVGLSR